MSWMIVTDSTSDLSMGMPTAEGVSFTVAPIRLIVEGREFIDDADLDVAELLDAADAYNDSASSACPSPEDFVTAFRKADYSIAITITSTLSGSYNSAVVAKNMVLEETPEKKIHVFDSLSTCGALTLLARKANELIAEGFNFEEVVAKLDAHNNWLQTVFSISSFNNLVKNGRVSKLEGFMANTLKIRAVGKATLQGELGVLHKLRGEEKAYSTLVDEMKNLKDPEEYGPVIVSHCFNLEGALVIKKMIEERYPKAVVEIRETGGLNSFYAERSGIIIGY